MSDKPTNVIEALVAVSRDVDAIAKEKTANAGGSFKYRGIEDVLSACHDPFIRYGVVVVPQVTQAEMIKHEVTRSSGKVGFDFEAQMTVNYRIYGPGGPQDFIDAPIFATGMDSSDKGTGKAMSYAYKQLMFQLLCIPTDAAEDNEARSAAERYIERESLPRFDAGPEPAWDEARWKALADRLRALPDIGRNAIVGRLTNAGLFKDRKPCTPFSDTDLDLIEETIAADPFDDAHARAAGNELSGPSERAIEVMALALNADDPLNPPDGVVVEPWMWDLAAVEDLDAHDWKITAKAAGMRQRDLIEEAAKAAEALEVEAPARLDEIHGDLAEELRVQLIRSGEPF